MPNLRAMGRGGFLVTGRSMMPSVTNVNNVSIVTAQYPSEHGICSNYRWDRETGEELYVESGEYIRSQSMFSRAEELGMTSVVVTSKDKLRTLVGVDATMAVSSEQPPDWVVDAVGPAPEIYSLEVNGWVIDAGRVIMKQRPADIVYLTTTDYAMHMNAPDHPGGDAAHGHPGRRHRAAHLGPPGRDGAVVGGPRMNAKSRMVDLKAVLAAQGIESNPVPIIKDRYTVHHSNLGGCMFVHLDPERADDAIAALRGHTRRGRGAAARGGGREAESQGRPDRGRGGRGRRRHGVRGRGRGDDARRPALPRLPARAGRADRRV